MFMRSRQSSYAVQRPHAWIKRVVVIGVLVGFVGLVSYVALNRDNIATEELNPTLVQAPDSAIKERAVEPGGMEVPHQDKEVFDLLSSSTEAENAELAAEATNAVSGATQAPAPVVSNPPADAAKQQAVEMVKPVETPKAAEPVATAKPVAAPKTETAAPVAAVKGWAVQLASFTKETDAQRAISTFRSKHTVLTNLQPHVRRVQLEKGTYYRVIFGGLPNSTAASAVCAELKKSNQGCLNIKL